MSKVKNFFDEIGIIPRLPLDEDAKERMVSRLVRSNLKEPVDRKFIILAYLQGSGELYLRDWNKYIDKKTIKRDLYPRINNIMNSISIYYLPHDNEMISSCYDNFFSVTQPYDVEMEEVLMLLKPEWKLTSIFMEKEEKEKEARKVLLDAVDEITNRIGLINILYEKLPELIKEEFSKS